MLLANLCCQGSWAFTRWSLVRICTHVDAVLPKHSDIQTQKPNQVMKLGGRCVNPNPQRKAVLSVWIGKAVSISGTVLVCKLGGFGGEGWLWNREPTQISKIQKKKKGIRVEEFMLQFNWMFDNQHQASSPTPWNLLSLWLTGSKHSKSQIKRASQ